MSAYREQRGSSGRRLRAHSGSDWPEGAYLLLSEVLSEADIDIGAAVDPFRP